MLLSLPRHPYHSACSGAVQPLVGTGQAALEIVFCVGLGQVSGRELCAVVSWWCMCMEACTTPKHHKRFSRYTIAFGAGCGALDLFMVAPQLDSVCPWRPGQPLLEPA